MRATAVRRSQGVAVLRFDANNVPNGIWVFTRNSIGTDSTFVLNGLADAASRPRPPHAAWRSGQLGQH